MFAAVRDLLGTILCIALILFSIGALTNRLAPASRVAEIYREALTIYREALTLLPI